VDDRRFQDNIRAEQDARRAARAVLAVPEEADGKEITRAYRRLAKAHHPDRQGGTAADDRRFTLINCAYELLTQGKPCPMLLERMAGDAPRKTGREEYRRDNPWGLFLWWRDRYFDGF